MTNKKQAEKYYKYFSKKEGNQHIANLFAIEKLLDLIELNKPKNILEIGLGIGTISYSIIDFLNSKSLSFRYFGTETNEFCLKELPKNLKDKYSKLNLYESIEKLPKNITYDFIIIDGSDKSIEEIVSLISNNSTIFIEGDRTPQQEILIKTLPKSKFVHTISNYKEPEYGPFTTGNWSGGGKLIYTNPTFKQNINWMLEKIKTSYRSRIIRKIYS